MRSPDSIKAHLKRLAVAEGRPFDYLLMYYFIERLLYRLSVSAYANDFILKGGLLLYTMLADDARVTRDVDFLAFGSNNTPEELSSIIGAICAIPADDAVCFDLDSISAQRIKEGADYEGVRLKVVAYIGKSRHTLQFDIGFGDAVVPAPVTMEYPSLLDMERPRIRAYSRETVIAEKFEAMIALSEANSRMKDLYDIFALSRMFDFDGIVLRESIRSTLTRRATPLAPLPAVFTTTFSKAKEKQAQWRAFQKRIKVAEAVELQDVLERIREFLQPVYLKILAGEDWKMHWNSTHSQWE